jgi:hypothetical protein
MVMRLFFLRTARRGRDDVAEPASDDAKVLGGIAYGHWELSLR